MAHRRAASSSAPASPPIGVPAAGTARRGLTLTIADTGSGISAAARQHLFEAFFTTKGINGNGLGLWISADIIQRHHGRLLLRSSQSPRHHGTDLLPLPPLPPTPRHHHRYPVTLIEPQSPQAETKSRNGSMTKMLSSASY